MGETLLSLRRIKFTMHFGLKLRGHDPIIPTKDILKEHWEFRGVNDRNAMQKIPCKKMRGSKISSVLVGAQCWKVAFNKGLM